MTPMPEQVKQIREAVQASSDPQPNPDTPFFNHQKGHPMPALCIQIPDDLDFSDLKLIRDPITHDVSFDWSPIEAICKLSGVDIAMFKEQHEDNVAGLISTWYVEHRQRGGAPDPVQEQLIAEVFAEDAAGGQAGVINHAGGLQ